VGQAGFIAFGADGQVRQGEVVMGPPFIPPGNGVSALG